MQWYNTKLGEFGNKNIASFCMQFAKEVIALNSLSGFFSSLDLAGLSALVIRIAAVFLCLTVHETCHGLAAYALGDPTAKSMRRLSFNPLHHIDWFGFASMVILGFGWAKPVPVDMRYFKKPKQGMALTALAGPVSNLVLAVVLFFGARTIYYHGSVELLPIFSFLYTAAVLSVGLGVFNLIPIPPLDGSKVLFALLPDRAYERLMHYERYGMLLLYALILAGSLDNFLGNAVSSVSYFLMNLIFGF